MNEGAIRDARAPDSASDGTLHASRSINLALIAGCLSAMTGVVAIVGWVSSNSALTELRPSSAPMVYNTAVGFLLGGIGLAALSISKLPGNRVARLLLITPGIAYNSIFGPLTLAEYVLHRSLGIDLLLFHPAHPSTVDYFYRPAPNTALNMTLVGIILAISLGSRFGRSWHAATATLASIVASVGAVALSGYALGISEFYSWIDLAKMSPQSAVGFVLTGTGFIALAWSNDDRREGIGPPWLPIPAGAATATGALALFQVIVVHTRLEHALIGPSVTGSNHWIVFTRTQEFLPVAVLGNGIAVACLLAWTIRLAQRAYAQSQTLRESNVQLSTEITKRSGLEDRLTEANEDLDQRVRERTRELEEVQTSLRRTNDELDQRVQERTSDLWKEKQFISAVLDNMHAGVVACDGDGVLTLFNPLAREYHKRAEEHVPADQWSSHYGIYLPDGKTLLPMDQIPLYRALKGEIVSNQEVVVVADGEPPRLVDVSGKSMRDEAGNLLGAVIVMHDITESKRAESKFRNLLEAAPDAIIAVNSDGVISLANALVEERFGYSREDLLGKSVEVLLPDRYRGSHLSHRVGFFNDPHVRPMGSGMELLGLKKDGTEFPVEVSLGPLDTEDGMMVLAAIRDITERKQAEEALKLSEIRFKNAFDNAPIGMALVGLDGRFMRVNKALCEIVGYTDDELLAFDFQAITYPDDLAGDLENAHRLIAGTIPHYEMEKRYYHKHGHVVWVLLSGSIMRDMEDKPLYFIAQILDISSRKEAEAKMLVQAENLARSNVELEQFAYIASHDMQEPLRKVQTFGHLLETKYADVLDVQGKDYLERMQAASARMQRLINDLLDLSKVSKSSDVPVLVDLGVVAREAVEDFEAISTLGAVIEIEALPKIVADPGQMRQLFQNLISNALKYHSQQTAPVVRISGKITGSGTCRIEVTDNGIGFEQAYAERIFAPFQRLHRREEYEGTGIGLAICRKIVERHHGTISARSSPGHGATFTIVLPMSSALSWRDPS